MLREVAMEQLLSVAMFLFPPFAALTVQGYLQRGHAGRKKKAVYFILYFVLINLLVTAVAYIRGVHGIRLMGMTRSFKLKYLGLGCAAGTVLAFLGSALSGNLALRRRRQGHRFFVIRFLQDVRKYLPYAVRSARADLRTEVTNSYLDWMWWLIEPFCTMLIYTFIFGVVFHAAEPYFPVFIFIGLTMWEFFARTVTGSVNVVRGSREIITRIYMPKYILLLSRMFVNAFKMLVSFLVIFGMMVFFRVPFPRHIFGGIPVLAVLFLFSFGVGSIMMHYGVYVSDLSYITGIVLKMLMYLTGTFYSVAKRIPAPYGEMLEKYNPIAFLISSMRNTLLYGTAPSYRPLLLWGAASVGLILLGVFIVYSNENAYVKVI